MQSEQFMRIEALFHAARAQPHAAQGRFVRESAGHDRDLAARVLRMLQFDRGNGGLTEALGEQSRNRRDVGSTAATASVGLQIGPYQLSELLGEGGFGAVYRARQDEPVRREVAIKILQIGLASPRAIARFEAERQALAIMDHPNIARIFDAGCTDEALGSRPYFVMEVVPGAPVTAHCDAQRLTVAERLALFAKVCRAVHHAHQKGVIHRDIKPSNILVRVVDGEHVPKVIDFGIAKALEGPLTDRTLVTEARQLLGTPQYMSPEQADPDASGVDTRSDIYALGVVLYELLTGATPLDRARLESAPLSALPQVIHDTTPLKPSTRVERLADAADEAARARGLDRSSLKRKLRGELDWIVMKAIDKDRERRYQSASEFADDIDRYLSGRAVLAGPPSALYQIRTLIRRHRLGLAASFVLLAAVIVGAAGLIMGAVRARHEADRAISVNEFMRDVLTSVDPQRDGADVRLVEVLDRASSTVADRFAGHPQQEAMVRDLLGDVYATLGFLDRLTEQLQMAAGIWRRELGPDDEGTLRAELRLAGAHVSAGNAREAETLITDLLPRLERVLGPDHPDTLEGRLKVTMTHLLFGRVDEAEAVARDTLARARALRPVDDQFIVRVEAILVGALVRKARMSADARTAAQQAQILDEAIDLAHRVIPRAGSQRGRELLREVARLKLGEALYLREDFEQSVHVTRSLLEDTADWFEPCHNVRTRAMATLACALGRLGQYREAADWYIERVECTRQNVPENHPVLLAALNDALPFLDFSGRWTEGEAYARELVDKFSQFGGSVHGRGDVYEMYIARFLSKQGRFEEADAMFNELLPRVGEFNSEWAQARLLLFHGGHLASRGLYEDAEAQILRAVAIMGAPENGTWRSHPDDILMELIALYEAWGKPEEADRYRALRSAPDGPPD